MGLLRSVGRQRRRLQVVRRAVEDGRWEDVVVTGEPLLDDHELPAEAAALLALEVGRAHLVLGQERDASRLLEQGLSGASSDPSAGPDLRPYRYWAGMAALILGDLERAREHLQLAARSDGADLQPYEGAAMRGLAQVEAELGRPEVALSLLDEVTERGDLSDMGLALRCVVLQRLGRDDEARFHLHGLLGGPEQLDGLDRAQRATLGTAVVVGGEVMVELGHPDGLEAAIARAEMALAGSGGIPATQTLSVLRAEAARMHGDLVQADRHLATVLEDDELAPEVRSSAQRAAARVAWVGGDGAAVAAYEAAAEAFEEIGFTDQARRVREEAVTGPVRPTPLPSARELGARLFPEGG